MKTCFLLFVAEDVSAAAAALEPIELGTPEVESIDTLVGDRALMTVLWKRAGMELASCVVVGRIRRAGWRHDTQVPAFIREVCAGRRHWTLTDLDRGRRPRAGGRRHEGAWKRKESRTRYTADVVETRKSQGTRPISAGDLPVMVLLR